MSLAGNKHSKHEPVGEGSDSNHHWKLCLPATPWSPVHVKWNSKGPEALLLSSDAALLRGFCPRGGTEHKELKGNGQPPHPELYLGLLRWWGGTRVVDRVCLRTTLLLPTWHCDWTFCMEEVFARKKNDSHGLLWGFPTACQSLEELYGDLSALSCYL